MSTIAISPVPAGAADQYAGQWIAIRDGEVIAAADTFEDLTANKDVRPTDVLYHVPEAGTYFFALRAD